MSAPVLYSFRRCPYAMRARMAIKYSGLECELREVVLKDKPEQMLRVSPKGTVPVLLLENTVIEESVDIMRWALQANDPDGWNVDELGHRLVQRNDEYFKHYLDRYKYFERYPEAPQHVYFEKALSFIDELEASMAVGKNGEPYMLTAQLGAIDVAIFPFIRQFAFVDKSRFDAINCPQLHKWLARLLEADLFQSVMFKHKQWKPQATEVVYV